MSAPVLFDIITIQITTLSVGQKTMLPKGSGVNTAAFILYFLHFPSLKLFI